MGCSQTTMPPKLINQMLTFLFAFESLMIGRLSLPFGVSILLLAKKNEFAEKQ